MCNSRSDAFEDEALSAAMSARAIPSIKRFRDRFCWSVPKVWALCWAPVSQQERGAMQSRRQFVRAALLGTGAALLPAAWFGHLHPQKATSTRDEIVLVDGWVLLVDNLAGMLG